MKYIIVLGDGMADEEIESLHGMTPLQYASTPNMDRLASKGRIGMTSTIPVGMKPGSDTANLSVLGYDPTKYYSGRSPLEALSIGISMMDSDIALRCNFVTLSIEEDFEHKRLLDHSSDEISTQDCAILLEAVRKELEHGEYHFYTGTSYRHCLIWENGSIIDLTAPHDILNRCILDYLPQDKNLYAMMKKSYDILVNHPLNKEREKQGKNPANCCWFWGAGTRPSLPDFYRKTGKRGAMISAVDLLKGIAVGAGMKVVEVEGANGGLHTNYQGKAEAAYHVLTQEDYDFVYIHIEAPDEMGHQGSVERKIQAIEAIDTSVIAPLTKRLDHDQIDYRLLLLPDHPTPVRIRTHTNNPVPFLLYDSTKEFSEGIKYNETQAAKSKRVIQDGSLLLDFLFSE